MLGPTHECIFDETNDTVCIRQIDDTSKLLVETKKL